MIWFWGKSKTPLLYRLNSEYCMVMWFLCAFSMYGQVNYEASVHWLGQVGSINFIVHLYPCGLLFVCFWVTGANRWAFDPCYFQLQTIDFNYQTRRSRQQLPRLHVCPEVLMKWESSTAMWPPACVTSNLCCQLQPNEIWWLLSIRLSPVEGWRFYTSDRNPLSLRLWREPEKKCWFGTYAGFQF